MEIQTVDSAVVDLIGETVEETPFLMAVRRGRQLVRLRRASLARTSSPSLLLFRRSLKEMVVNRFRGKGIIIAATLGRKNNRNRKIRNTKGVDGEDQRKSFRFAARIPPSGLDFRGWWMKMVDGGMREEKRNTAVSFSGEGGGRSAVCTVRLTVHATLPTGSQLVHPSIPLSSSQRDRRYGTKQCPGTQAGR